jgi:hypothetical protein
MKESRISTASLAALNTLFADWAAVFDPAQDTAFSDALLETPVKTDSGAITNLRTTNGLHVITQATAGRRPTWRNAANGLNGNPAIQFDGTATQFLGGTSMASLVTGVLPFWIIWVQQYTGSGGSTPFSFTPTTYATDANEIWFRNISVGSNDRLQAARGVTSGLQVGDSDATVSILEYEYDGAFVTTRLNGRRQARVATTESVTPNRFALGTRQINTNPADSMTGKLGWWGLRSGLVTPEQREVVRRALARRFNLTTLGSGI